MDYKPVIESIFEKETKTVGQLACRVVEKHENISYEDELVFDSEPTKSDLEDFLELFKDIQGKGAIGIARKAMSDYLDPDMDIDLPEEIMPQEIKEKNFVSGL